MRAHVFMIALTAYSNRWNNVSKTLQAFLVNFQMILVNRLTDKHLKNVSAHIVIDYYDFVDRMNNGKKIAEHIFLSIFDSETKLSVSVQFSIPKIVHFCPLNENKTFNSSIIVHIVSIHCIWIIVSIGFGPKWQIQSMKHKRNNNKNALLTYVLLWRP